MPKKYPEKLRSEVLDRFESGQLIEELSQTYKITQSTIYRWIKESESIVVGGEAYSLSNSNKIVRQKELPETVGATKRKIILTEHSPPKEQIQFALAIFHISKSRSTAFFYA